MPSARSVCSLIDWPAPRRVGDMPVAVDQRPLGRCPAVVEDRLADQLDLDVAVQAPDRAHQHVVGVVVRGRPGVRGDHVLARRAGPWSARRGPRPSPTASSTSSSGRSSRARTPRRRVVDAERPEPEVARLPVEQGPEDAGRVEPRDAEPADRAVGRHQGAGVAVGEEREVGDRWERGGRCRALWLGRWRSRRQPGAVPTAERRWSADPPRRGPSSRVRTRARAVARRAAAA